ncbi:hypothetical protein GQ53DRAFT_507245 [Thozetella sp. PMI_491]|nr:hypothetical protein GQ53DRAFT_507245 [Thozetella sp. PMI_491]
MKPFRVLTEGALFLLSIAGLVKAHPEVLSVKSVPAVRDCAIVRWVVIDSHEIEIYDEVIHGTSKSLRVFDKLSAGCSGNLLAMRHSDIELSTRSDVQIRDPETGLSTFLYKRGFLSWARSIFKWVDVSDKEAQSYFI